MTLVLLQMEMLISGSASLKEKRVVLKKIKDKLRNNFNVSVAETGFQDKWQRAQLAVAVVTSEKKIAEKIMQKLFNFLDSGVEFEMINHQIEYL
jgi:uncharacterized protein YlxP (DUF503 family)